MEGHDLKPEPEDAAEDLERVQAGAGSAADIADGVGAPRGKQREAAVGDAGSGR